MTECCSLIGGGGSPATYRDDWVAITSVNSSKLTTVSSSSDSASDSQLLSATPGWSSRPSASPEHARPPTTPAGGVGDRASSRSGGGVGVAVKSCHGAEYLWTSTGVGCMLWGISCRTGLVAIRGTPCRNTRPATSNSARSRTDARPTALALFLTWAQLCMWRRWLITTTFESGGDCHHHFFKVEFAIFQAISHNLGNRIVFFLLPEAFCGLKYAENAGRTPLGKLTTLPQTP